MAISFRKDSPEDAAFRAELRAWLERNVPGELRGLVTYPPKEAGLKWQKMLREAGYLAPHWPKRWGGSEKSFTQQLIFQEELARAKAPGVGGQGFNHIGPIIMQFGTEEQKRQHLPKIISGEVTWCQGYSEPNSGSDLSSLRTRAEMKDDHFLVNGQKIWTSGAHKAEWIFMLVRTDPEAKPQAGISFILADMKTPGITPRAIQTIAGEDELAEVFLDDVRVPKENLIGKLNDGWRVANALLVNERIGSGNPQLCFDVVERVHQVAAATGADGDPAFRDRLAQAELETVTYAALYAHVVQLVTSGIEVGPDASMMKITGSELLQRTTDLMMEAAGGHGIEEGWFDTGDGRTPISVLYRQVRRVSIYGGSNEIQRNILARRVLDLPSWRGG
jgi:alkylation response protein AidB-like acyl-CoA dehydrogenase